MGIVPSCLRIILSSVWFRRGRPKKVGICTADDKCAGCIRKTGCERVKLSQPATSAPAESQPQQEPRKRQKAVEMYVPEALWDHRKDSHEAARKTAKPPPVTESPIGARVAHRRGLQASYREGRKKPGRGQV